MTDGELLDFIYENEDWNADEISDQFADEVAESTIRAHLLRLWKKDLVRRHWGDEGLEYEITSTGERILGFQPSQNPREKSKINSNKREVIGMVVSVKIQDDLVEELDSLMDNEELTSYAEAVDFALADYFDLLEADEEIEAEFEESR